MGERRFLMARTLRVTVGRLILLAYRVRIEGEENLPETGAILCGNHVSYLDPVVLWISAPRPVHFMGKSELFEGGLLGWALPRVWAFPIRRGTADREAITAASKLLADGDLVGIFPEGTRHREGDGNLAEAQAGAAFIAMRATCPIIPFGIAGTDRAMPEGAKLPRFPRVAVRYGEPIDPSAYTEGSRKERLASMTSDLMLSITEQLALAREDR